MLFVTMILLCDTILFVIMGNFLARDHFFRKMPWLVFLLFPWFGVLLWLAQPAKKLYQNNGRRYYACLWFLDGAGFALMVLGACRPDDKLYIFGWLLCLWVWIGDILVHRDGEDGKQDDPDEPIPDGPTPTGDAVDAWLKELSQAPTYR